jgi:hypothetical protein
LAIFSYSKLKTNQTMNKYQTAKHDSLKLIVKESKNNPESIAKVPKFGIVVNRIEEICNEIEPHQIEQEKNLTGITVDKDIIVENLTDSTVEISGAVYSYAHDINDNALMARVNYKSTRLESMSQSKLVAVAGVVLEEALKIPTTDLANEGISGEDLTAYQELIARFSVVKSSKKEAVIDRSGTTKKLNNLFKEASSLLKDKLDRLAVQFKRKDPEFYLKYKAARSVHYRSAAKKETDAVVNEPQ